MEKQSNLDLEQTNPERTSISTDGLSPSQGTPSLNLVYDEPNLKAYIADLNDGEFTLHVLIKEKITIERLRHFRELFNLLILELMDKGLDHIDTWIETHDTRGIRFAEFYGFEETGFLKVLGLGPKDYVCTEMRYTFPQLDEGLRD